LITWKSISSANIPEAAPPFKHRDSEPAGGR
jgi:hypothetical protein